jgi:protein-disulfide isomerase
MSQLLDGEYAALGPATAPVTVVVFSDFECPYCKKLRALLAAEPLITGGKVRLVFRHMPMQSHKWAQKAAEAAVCAQLQNGDAFWHLHDSLFENPLLSKTGFGSRRFGQGNPSAPQLRRPTTPSER